MMMIGVSTAQCSQSVSVSGSDILVRTTTTATTNTTTNTNTALPRAAPTAAQNSTLSATNLAQLLWWWTSLRRQCH